MKFTIKWGGIVAISAVMSVALLFVIASGLNAWFFLDSGFLGRDNRAVLLTSLVFLRNGLGLMLLGAVAAALSLPYIENG